MVIAAYNEEAAIESVLRSIPAEVCGLGVDVLVVVDGADDGTAAVARGRGVLVCDVPVNRGQGAALRLGYRLARTHGARFIATLDADGQYDPAELARGRRAARGRAGRLRQRFPPPGRGPHHRPGPGDRAWWCSAALISLLTGQRVTDPANGLRAMRAEVTGRGRAAPAPVPGDGAADRRGAAGFPGGRGTGHHVPSAGRARRRRAATSAMAPAWVG